MDDVYVVTIPERARAAFDIFSAALKEHAGVEADLGKCRVWNRGGLMPPGITDLGPDVWRGDKTLQERGLKILGAPLGTPQYVSTASAARLEEERKLTDLLPQLPDLQAAWLLLLFCASPLANHWLRVLPPELSNKYAANHDCKQP